jgi:O-antigen ligase
MRTVTFWLSLILIFMIPWENNVTVAELGTLTRVMGLLVAAVWLVTILVAGRFRKPNRFHVAVYLFVLWNVVSAFWSVDVEATTQRIKTYLQLAGLVWILWDLYTTPEALKAGLQAYVLGAYVSIGSTVGNYLAGNAFNDDALRRYTGAGLNANDLALILALGLPVAWHLAVSAVNDKESHVLKLVNYAYIPAALFAILLTASRMALFCTVPALLFILGTFSQLKLHSRAPIFVALIGILFTFQPYIPQTSYDRLATVGSSIARGDLGGRAYTWHEGIMAFWEHPVFGVGSGAFATVAMETRQVAHNTFLSVLVELGIIGFALFVVILVVAVYQALRQPKRYLRLWLTVLLVWAIGVSALTWEYTKPTWLFLGLVIVSASLHSRRDISTTPWWSPVEPSGLPTLSAVLRDTSPNLESARQRVGCGNTLVDFFSCDRSLHDGNI